MSGKKRTKKIPTKRTPRISKNDYDSNIETRLVIFNQIIFPLLIAGFGMVLAGILFDHVKNSVVFSNVSEIFILLPALLGLKGNIEMTMTSRLSSLANSGSLNKQSSIIFRSNIALAQCQSIVIGFMAALLANIIQSVSQNQINFQHFYLICTISIVTSSLTSFLLGEVMITVIKMAIKYRINPDNVAIPLAAALGDLVTLGVLYFFASVFYHLIESLRWLLVIIILSYLISVKWLAKMARVHQSAASALDWNCWLPMLVAMSISSLSGFILSHAVIYFDRIAAYQPLVNGFGGNIASIQASKLSSHLHLISTKKKLKTKLSYPKFPSDYSNTKDLFGFLFKRNDRHSISAQTLLMVVIPFHLIFFFILNSLSDDPISNVLFLLFYLSATLTQVFILLYLTGILIQKLWSNGYNPDNSSIPYLTSFGDLSGTTLLTLAFYGYEKMCN